MKNDLQFELDAERLIRAISRTTQLMADPVAMIDAIGAQIESNVRARVITQRDAAGNALKPLAQSTIESRAKRGRPADQVLIDSGAMLAGLAYNRVGLDVEVGYAAPYAVFHVTGTRRMPRRDTLFAALALSSQQATLAAEDEADVLAIVEEFTLDALEG